MAVTSSFFGSINHDRRYKPADFAAFFADFIGNGVYAKPSSGLQVFEKSNMTITVKPGTGFINGYRVNNDSDYDITLATADGVLKRIDRIVLQWDNVQRKINIVAKKGAFASNPVAPSLERSPDYYELALADVLVSPGVTRITQANITDQRLNNALCGVVTGLISQVDTTTLFNQYQSWFNSFSSDKTQAFNDWLATLQDVLDENTAGNLMNLINTNKAELAQHKNDLVSHGIYGTATGTNTLVMSDNKVTSYVEGMLIAFKNTTASTLATTLNINSLGAKPILKANGTAVTNLRANAIYQVRYSGTSFYLLGEGGEYGTAKANDVLSGKTFGTDDGVLTGTLTVESLGGTLPSDIITYNLPSKTPTRCVTEVDKINSKVAYGEFSTSPGYGYFATLSGTQISSKYFSGGNLQGWYSNYYVIFINNVISFFNHNDELLFSLPHTPTKGLSGVCLYKDVVVIIEYYNMVFEVIYKSKTGSLISSFTKNFDSNYYAIGDSKIRLNQYKVPLIYHLGNPSDAWTTSGIIKLNGVNTITHKKVAQEYFEHLIKVSKDYITKD